MSASRRFPMSRFQPGIAAIKAWTGASPSAFAICGLPPERSTTDRSFRLDFALAFGGTLGFLGGILRLLAFGRVQGHGGTDQRLERRRVDLLAFLEIDGAPGVALEAGIEEALGIVQRRALRESHLHHGLVGLAGADDAVML